MVLASAFGPNAMLFARSASFETTYEHAAHVHDGGGTCFLDENGWINFKLRVSVHTKVLGEDYYSCKEPEGTTLREELDRVVGL
ncbi:MAG: hypothetical protein WD598_00990 [Acidimicrobiia bacterium]